jgi:hypothetical protein
MQSYIAYYEDAALVEAAAKKRGFTGNDGESWHDFVEAEHDKFRRAKQFRKLDRAEKWLKAEINANKSVYGQGTIVLQEVAKPKCRACDCGGLRELHEYIVDDTGVVEDRDIESVCLD